MGDYIKLGFTAILAIFIFFGILWGVIRGLKRTTSRLVFLLLTSIILLFVTIPITKLLLNIPINMTIENNGEIVAQGKLKISEIIAEYIKIFLGEEFINKNPQFVSVLTAIPLVLANAFVYLILFWLLKYLLLPLDHLLYKLIFNRKKKKAENLAFAAWDFGDGDTKPLPQNNTETTQNSTPTPPTDTTPTDTEPVQLTPKVSSETMAEVDVSAEKENTTTTQAATSEPAPTTTNSGEVGMFIKKEDDIAKANATASAMPTYAEAHSDEPKKEKHKKEKIKKEKQPKGKSTPDEAKPKKYRLLGGLVGAVIGLLITINTMMPLYGVLNIAESNKDTEVKNLGDSTYSLDSASNGLASEILDAYNGSLMHTISGSIGLEKLYLTGFDRLTTTTINGKKIVLRDDVNNIVETVVKADNTLGLYKTISDNGIENITQEQLDDLLASVGDLVEQSKKVQLLNCLADYLLPVAANYITANEIKLAKDDKINDLILDAINNLTLTIDIDMFEEVEGLLDIANYINDQKLLIHIITNKYDDPVEIVHNLDDDFSNTIVNKVLSLKLVDSTLSNVFNIGLTALDNAIHFGYIEEETTKEQIISSFTDVMNYAFTAAKTITYDSPIYITEDSLEPIGKLLDTVKSDGLISVDTYNNIVSYATTKLKQLSANIVPDQLKDYVNNALLENIRNVTIWEDEMARISNAIAILRDKDAGILGTVKEGDTKRTGFTLDFSMSESVLNNLGVFLDKLEASELFGGASSITDSASTTHDSTAITKLFTNLLDYAREEITQDTDSELNDMLDIIDDMKDNIIKCGHQTSDVNFWSGEISRISPLISSVYTMLDANDFTLSQTLGADLDRAKESEMLGGNTTLKIVKIAMDKVQDMVLGENYVDSGSNSLNDQILALFNDIKTTLDDPDTETMMLADDEFWSNEIVCFESLQKISEQSNVISDISSCLALADDLDQAYNSKIIAPKSLDKIIATVIRKTKTNDTTGINGKINNLIDTIATDIEDDDFFYSESNPTGHSRLNFWAVELEHINNLKSLDLDNSDPDNAGNIADNIRSIGEELDKVVSGYTVSGNTIRGSYLITEARVRDILATAIEEMSADIVGTFDASMSSIISPAITSIKDNIANTSITISSFAYELDNIAKLTEIEISDDIFTIIPADDPDKDTKIATLNNKLKNIGGTLDSIAFNTVYTQDYVYRVYGTNNSNIVTRTILSTLIKDTFGLAKNSSTSNTYEIVFNTLIDDIQTSIQTTAITGNKVFSWERELAFVTTLTTMNQNQSYSLSNASTTIAGNIDAIAFNHAQINLSETYLDLQYSSDKLIGGYYETNNSLFITRSILKDAVAGLVEDFKISGAAAGSKDEITNELIDNISTTINTTTTYNTTHTLYNTYAELFTELNDVKNSMETLSDDISASSNIIDNTTATTLDEFLDNTQNKLICGVITTRKIARTILHDVKENIVDAIHSSNPMLTDAQINSSNTIQYINSLDTHYGNEATSTTPENYNVDTSVVDTFKNPFRSILDHYNAEFSTP